MPKDANRTERLVVLLTKAERQRFIEWMFRQGERSESSMARKVILEAIDAQERLAADEEAELQNNAGR